MVTRFPVVTTFLGPLASENSARPAIERLDPEVRVAVVMALLGIIILGVALVTFILLIGSWARRQGGARRAAGQAARASSYIAAAADADDEDRLAAGETEGDDGATDERQSEIDTSSKDTAGGDSFGWRETVAGD